MLAPGARLVATFGLRGYLVADLLVGVQLATGLLRSQARTPPDVPRGPVRVVRGAVVGWVWRQTVQRAAGPVEPAVLGDTSVTRLRFAWRMC